MEFSLEPQKTQHKSSSSAFRAKSSLRLRYEAEAQIILRKFGGLRGLQTQMGLNQRKICQLLMVDPSAWTRWLKDESKVPPHILRACEWYLAVNEKYPGFDVHFWLHSQGKAAEGIFEKTSDLQKDLKRESGEMKNEVRSISEKLSQLRSSLAQRKNPNMRWFVTGLTLGSCLILFMIYFGTKILSK